jgi:bacterioferritin
MDLNGADKKAVVGTLNKILELELAGVVRYTHYSLMVYGYNRIPIVSWLREQATESLAHALAVGPLLETHKHDIGSILKESLEAEQAGLQAYRDLLALVDGKCVSLEEYAREMILAEEQHSSEVEKMLRQPGK